MRFGDISNNEIAINVENCIPKNTANSKSSIWAQFELFTEERKYQLLQTTPVEELANILEDYGFNMKRLNGEDYKESVIKTMWNVTAKMLQEKYYNDFGMKIEPFTDIRFKKARDARDAKRRILQEQPNKRKVSSTALTKDEIFSMARFWNEEEPEGLQKRFYHIAAFELAWRGGEAAKCMTYYFKEELNNDGTTTGRIEYNPVFTKTTQGGSKRLSDSKYLSPNLENQDICPVRLLHKILEKRNKDTKAERLFLTPNPFWLTKFSKGWYKHSPIGVNEISKWTKLSALHIGLDVKRKKITNHSNRAAAVTELSKGGVSEQKLIKITGHSNSQSIKPYLNIDKQHHTELIQSMRTNNMARSMTSTITASTSLATANSSLATHKEDSNNSPVVYNNCIFNNCVFK